MALAAGSIVGAFLTPALSRDGDERRGDRDERREHADKGWHKGEWRRERGPVYEEPYYYSRPVYAPPPVYYPPQQSPGINLFLPLDIRTR